MKRGDYILCPICEGKGRVFDHTAGVMTFGVAYLFGKEKCRQCHGKGYIQLR